MSLPKIPFQLLGLSGMRIAGPLITDATQQPNLFHTIEETVLLSLCVEIMDPEPSVIISRHGTPISRFLLQKVPPTACS